MRVLAATVAKSPLSATQAWSVQPKAWSSLTEQASTPRVSRPPAKSPSRKAGSTRAALPVACTEAQQRPVRRVALAALLGATARVAACPSTPQGTATVLDRQRDLASAVVRGPAIRNGRPPSRIANAAETSTGWPPVRLLRMWQRFRGGSPAVEQRTARLARCTPGTLGKLPAALLACDLDVPGPGSRHQQRARG